MKLKDFLNLVLIGIFTASCDQGPSRGTDPIPPSMKNPRPSELSQKVSFQDIYTQVIQPKCLTCHGSSSALSLDSYARVHSNLEGIRKVVLMDRTMPKLPVSPLTQSEVELLTAWFEAGGPEMPLNGGTSLPIPIKKIEPKFDSLKEMIFQTKCLSCHSPGGKAERVPLVRREDFLESPLEIVIPGNSEESGLMLAIQPDARKRMPPPETGMSALSAEEISAIEVWIKNGAKD